MKRPSRRVYRSPWVVVCWAWLASGCCSAAAGAATGGPTIAPIAVTTNAGGGTGTGPTPQAESAFTLWCARPGGSACAQAASTLAVAPTDTAAIPEAMLGPMRDTENDCEDPEIAAVTARLQGPLGITPRNWHDNVGAQLRRESIAQTYSGGGCTNCCFARDQPAVKVHAIPAPSGTRFVVRVWEIGEFANPTARVCAPGRDPTDGARRADCEGAPPCLDANAPAIHEAP